MSDEEKLQKAKEVADRLSGDVIEFEVNGQKYIYHRKFEEKMEHELQERMKAIIIKL